MSHPFDYTRASAEVWRDLADDLLWHIREWQAAILDGASDPDEVDRLSRAAHLAAADARGFIRVPDPGYPKWDRFAAKEPAIAAALGPFAKALGEIGPNEAWEPWDGVEFVGTAEVLRTLAALKRALGDDPTAYEQVVTLDQARIFARVTKDGWCPGIATSVWPGT